MTTGCTRLNDTAKSRSSSYLPVPMEKWLALRDKLKEHLKVASVIFQVLEYLQNFLSLVICPTKKITLKNCLKILLQSEQLPSKWKVTILHYGIFYQTNNFGKYNTYLVSEFEFQGIKIEVFLMAKYQSSK